MTSPRIITIAAQKGGVGKTTTVANLAATWAVSHPTARGLVIDLDPQTNLTLALEDHITGVGEGSAAAVLKDAITDPTRRIIPSDISTVTFGDARVDLLPAGGSALHGIEESLVVAPGGERALTRALTGTGYDWVLIDTRPSEGRLTMNAVATSGHVIAVVNPAKWSAEGGQKATAFVASLTALDLSSAVYAGAIMCKVPAGTRVVRDQVLADLAEVGAVLFEPSIPLRTDAEVGEYLGSPMVISAPRSAAARAYKHVAAEVWAATGPAELKVVGQ